MHQATARQRGARPLAFLAFLFFLGVGGVRNFPLGVAEGGASRRLSLARRCLVVDALVEEEEVVASFEVLDAHDLYTAGKTLDLGKERHKTPKNKKL